MSSKNKTLVVVIVLVIALLGLVYFVLTKGYSGKVINISTILQSPTPTQNTQQETAVETLSKISLSVTSPIDGETLNSTNVTVKGKTVPNADVFVNDQSGKADAGGNFSISIGLDEGSNVLVVLANDANGNAAEQDLAVMVSSFQ